MKPKKRRRNSRKRRSKEKHLNTAAGNWSELPKDILNLISERLDNEFELIHFRSVCSHWRSSSISNLNTNNIPFMFPIKFNSDSDDSNDDNNIINMPFCSLSQHNIFLIKPLQQTRNRGSVLIRVTQNSSAKSKLSLLIQCDLPCPFSIDLTKFSIHHFGTDFIVDESLSSRYIHPKKFVVVTPHILAILLRKCDLVLLYRGDECWTEIPYKPSSIKDICLFKGQIYAVEMYSGETVIVAPKDLSIQLAAKRVNAEAGTIKYLVESEGELLLVDISHSLFSASLTIDVYRLDEKEKEWVKLTSLGDRILFLSDGCSFSTSALDLCVTKGNCVLFMDNDILYGKICDTGICVFDLDQGRPFPLRHYPHYVNLFWPAPDWIDINCMR